MHFIDEKGDRMGRKILLDGVPVSKGEALGKARVIKEVEDLELAEQGEILVLPNSHPMYALAVMKAAGIICEAGGMLSHICIVSLEMGLPCITKAKGATVSIKNGDMVFLDAANGKVYIDE